MSSRIARPEAPIDQALAVGDLQEALQAAASAEQQHPGNAAVQHRCGLVLLRLERAEEALTKLTNAVRLDPMSVETRLALAEAYLALNDGFSAAAWVSDACRVAPQQPQLWMRLVDLLAAQNRQAEVEPVLRSAVAANPQHKPLVQALSEYYLDCKRYADGVKTYEQLLALDGTDGKTLLHYALCLQHVRRLEEAAQRYRDAIALRPEFLEAHGNLAGVLWRLGDFNGSLAHAQRAVQLSPGHPLAVQILGTSLKQLHRVEQAEAQLRRGLELMPDSPAASLELALLLLQSARFDEAWRFYQYRWNDPEGMHRPPRYPPQLQWQGPRAQPLNGKRILIYAEQGLGDVIQFIRYARLVQADGATVCCAVPSELTSLVESMPRLTALKPGLSIAADWHVALLDLPQHYRTNLENIPADVPYLCAPADKIAQWRERLAKWDRKLKVGIAWAGNHLNTNYHNRCMPLSQFRPLLAMAGVQCFSLQRSDGERYTDLDLAECGLVDFTAQWGDFTDSAAMVANLDLVISTDTAVVHLAGAIGKPVWTILPPNPDWRWLLEREDSPWYPTMRLFRRGHNEPRAAQMARVAKALKSGRKSLLAARALEVSSNTNARDRSASDL